MLPTMYNHVVKKNAKIKQQNIIHLCKENVSKTWVEEGWIRPVLLPFRSTMKWEIWKKTKIEMNGRKNDNQIEMIGKTVMLRISN